MGGREDPKSWHPKSCLLSPLEEPLDTPYGDRRAMVRDPFGNVFQARRTAIDRSLIRLVGIVDIDVEESGEQLSLAGCAHHDQRVADTDLGGAVEVNLARGVEHRSQELDFPRHVADDHARRDEWNPIAGMPEYLTPGRRNRRCGSHAVSARNRIEPHGVLSRVTMSTLEGERMEGERMDGERMDGERMDGELLAEDGVLLAKAAAEDLDAAFAPIVAAYGRAVYTIALRLGTQPADAEDLAAETFVRAYRALGGYPPARTRALQLRPWLVTITLNLWRNQLRDAGRRPRHGPLEAGSAPPDPAPGPEQAAEAIADSEQLAILLAVLPQDQRVAIVLRHVVGLPYGEIADSLRCPVGTVKSQVSRGLATLRSRMQPDEEVRS